MRHVLRMAGLGLLLGAIGAGTQVACHALFDPAPETLPPPLAAPNPGCPCDWNCDCDCSRGCDCD